MRFYAPGPPVERFDSLELFPTLAEKKGAEKCLKMNLYPSVTTVLSVIREEYLERWFIKEAIKMFQDGLTMEESVDQIYSRESPNAKFGTDCHAMGEWWFGAAKPEVSELVEAHSAPLLRWFDNNVKEIIFSERLLASPTMKVAGAVDFGYIRKDGVRCVGDLKVVKYSSKYPPAPGHTYRMQLSAYREMLREDDGHDYHRTSLYLASPFGWNNKPYMLPPFEHTKCHLDEFKACRLLWEGMVTQPPFISLSDKLAKPTTPGSFDPTKFRKTNP
jgi:hypothetical protein